MLTPGLVSVTFRPLSRGEITAALRESTLPLIEWGGDVHVPPMDDAAIADAVGVAARDGISVASYGSYYRCTADADARDAVVETAVRLGAPHIRVWAGTVGSADATDDMRADTVANLRAICDLAAKHDILVSPEFHQGTLTDHYESALRLVDEVAANNLRLYWQPNQFRDDDYNRAAIRAVLPYLSNVHVFTWDARAWYPLADGERMWRDYMDVIASDGRDHAMLMEFVPGNTVEQFRRDAETLRRWLEK